MVDERGEQRADVGLGIEIAGGDRGRANRFAQADSEQKAVTGAVETVGVNFKLGADDEDAFGSPIKLELAFDEFAL